ncbi:hypothetical protein [Streptomyces violaceusniger]|uniref:hypothetical protein n=1 Tax=Streptomyces violaceusniger TaxID=68280 RepID=UPI0038015CB4
MDRAELHTLIDAALDSIGCDECRGVFASLMAAYAVRDAGSHNTKDLGDKVLSGELTPIDAYDQLSASMRPLYDAMGMRMSDEENARLRKAFLRIASRDLN